MPEQIKAQKGFHYAYLIIVAGLLTQITLIFCQQSFAQVMADFLEYFNITKTDAGIITSTFGMVYALSAVLWGWVNDRIGSRWTYAVMGTGASVMLICFANFTTDVLVGTVLYSIMGFFAGGMAAASLPKLCASWFTPSKRGFGMAFISIGGVISGALVGIIVPQILVATGSWSMSLTIMGLLALALTVIYTIIFRDKPSDKGLDPLGPEEEVRLQVADQEKTGSKKAGLSSYVAALKLKPIWILGIMYILYQFAYSGTSSFMALSFRELGYDAILAGYAVTIYNVAQIVGQLFFANLSDHIQRKLAMALGCWSWGLFGCVFAFVYGQPLVVMYIVVFLLGIGLGSMAVKQAIMCDYIPGEIRGTGSGVVATFAIVGRYLGPLLTGIISDAWGIQWAFLVMGIVMACAGLVVMILPKISKAEAI